MRNARVLGPGADAANHLHVRAERLIARPADLARVVRGDEGPNHESAGLDVLDLSPNFFNDADVFVSHNAILNLATEATVGPQAGTAHARQLHLDDGVRRSFERWILAFDDADESGFVHDYCAQNDFLLYEIVGVSPEDPRDDTLALSPRDRSLMSGSFDVPVFMSRRGAKV